MWNDSFGVCVKPDLAIASNSIKISLNDGRLCGSLAQQPVIIERNKVEGNREQSSVNCLSFYLYARRPQGKVDGYMYSLFISLCQPSGHVFGIGKANVFTATP